MNQKTCSTYTIKIFVAGSFETILSACREYCANKGFCVSVEKTEFVYTGGMESGACVNIINYARFPEDCTNLQIHASDLASLLMDKCFQRSCTVQTPEHTHFLVNQKIYAR